MNNTTLEIVTQTDSFGSTWHVFQDMLLVCEFLISLYTMISVKQWRSSIGSFFPQIMGRKCVIDENLCEICRDNVNCEKGTCNDSKVMCNLLVTASIIALLLIVSGNVELNPRPMKKCAKCEKMMPTGSNNCKCGYLLCYVAARVLHFSIFIYTSTLALELKVVFILL